MKIVMDSDCLVKLTKSGAKEIVAASMEVHIPYLVKMETVDDVKERGYQDTLMIEENIEKNILHVVRHRGTPPRTVTVSKGEEDVVSLFLKGGYDAIASDDRRFLKKLEAANIPYLTPCACILYLYYIGSTGRPGALELLEGLRQFVGSEEYEISKLYLEDKR